MSKPLGLGLTLCVVLLSFLDGEIIAQKHARSTPPVVNATAVIWHRPPSIASRDLFYGVGGKENEPSDTVTFVKEDSGGSNPKFIVRDSRGQRWKVKLGSEAGVETSATRFLWAVGYLTDEDYYRSELLVNGLQKLKRGQQFVSSDGTVHGARLEHQYPNIKKIGSWSWEKNAFTGTREFHGLAVMMALINNWDLKAGNNAIYQVGSEQQYRVGDLGATFGDSTCWWRSKANLAAYRKSRFLRKASEEDVDLRLPTRPPWLFAFVFPFYIQRTRVSGIAEDLPIQDVQWIGQLLSQLSKRQISDAFRAGGLSPRQVEGFTQEVQRRISELHAIE